MIVLTTLYREPSCFWGIGWQALLKRWGKYLGNLELRGNICSIFFGRTRRDIKRQIWDQLIAWIQPKKCWNGCGSWAGMGCSIIPGGMSINNYWLVVWNFFSHILRIIIPTDFHIFERVRDTTNQIRSQFFWGSVKGARVLTQSQIVDYP